MTDDHQYQIKSANAINHSLQNQQPFSDFNQNQTMEVMHTEADLQNETIPIVKEEFSGMKRFVKMEYYKKYFQVSQAQIIDRLKTSLSLPIHQKNINHIKAKPDFYGPFWILTTLVLLLSSVGNFSNYLLSKFSSGQIWNQYACTLIYSFGLGVPATIYFAIKFMNKEQQKDRQTFQQSLCIYGYSMTSYLPAVLLSLLPISIFQWILLLYSTAYSCVYLITAIAKKVPSNAYKIIVLIICIFQFILLLCFKLIFLNSPQL